MKVKGVWSDEKKNCPRDYRGGVGGGIKKLTRKSHDQGDFFHEGEEAEIYSSTRCSREWVSIKNSTRKSCDIRDFLYD